MYSRIVRFTAVAELNRSPVLLETLRRFAKEHAGNQLVLMGCTDEYADLIIENKALLEADYIIPYTTKELAASVCLKDRFCDYCQKFGIPHPKTCLLYTSRCV